MKPDNIYYRARMAAAALNPLFASRERVAGMVYCSQESLADYENGDTVPPCAVVQKMLEAYGAHDLRGQHIRSYCPMMTEYGNEEPSKLAQAALGWALAFGTAQEVAQQFAVVARDGRISTDEEAAARMIRSKSVEIMRVMQETIDAIDKAMAERTQHGRT